MAGERGWGWVRLRVLEERAPNHQLEGVGGGVRGG